LIAVDKAALWQFPHPVGRIRAIARVFFYLERHNPPARAIQQIGQAIKNRDNQK
jgi:hypothetical protein